MPSPEFLAGLLVLALTFAGALALATLTGLDPTWTLIAIALIVWGIAAIWNRRLTRRLETPETQPIRVDWEDRLSETDFAVHGATTVQDLNDRGLTPETAVGKNFVFVTEHAASNGDIWFEGTVLHDEGRLIIRSEDPV